MAPLMAIKLQLLTNLDLSVYIFFKAGFTKINIIVSIIAGMHPATLTNISCLANALLGKGATVTRIGMLALYVLRVNRLNVVSKVFSS